MIMRILFVTCAFQIGFSLLGQKYMPLKGRANIAEKILGHHFSSRITATSPISPTSVDLSIKHSDVSEVDVELDSKVTDETALSSAESPSATVDHPSVFISPPIAHLPVDTLPSSEPLKSKSISSRIKFPSWHSPRGENDELIRELVAGSVAALVTIPTSIAYATIIGLSPLIGVWTSAIVGLGVCLVGGAPGLIAGAAGVVAVPLAKLVSLHGPHTMGVTVLMAGIMEALFGVAKLGKFADMVTEPVVVGFLNAFAIFLVKSQVSLCLSFNHYDFFIYICII